MAKCPYTFPDRTRKAMLAYLAEHKGYCPMNTWNGGFVLAWNIKVHNADYSGKSSNGDFKTNDRFDAQWDSCVQDSPSLFNDACESATRQYTDKEWTNWPGIEQGEWDFGINGRSGGYMILMDAPAWIPKPQGWACCKMTWDSRGDYQDWLNRLDTPTLKQFYRAIRILDCDLRSAACDQEVSYQFAFFREQWEESLLAAENCDARKQEAARPDLYGGA